MTAPSPSPTPPPAVDQVREVLTSVCEYLPGDASSDDIVAALLPAVSALLAEARADGEVVGLNKVARHLHQQAGTVNPQPYATREVREWLDDRIELLARAAIRQTEGNNR